MSTEDFTARYRAGEQKVFKWLAGTVTGSIVKVSAGASLAWLAEHITDYSLPAIVAVAITAAVPVTINAINPVDTRYGKDSVSDAPNAE